MRALLLLLAAAGVLAGAYLFLQSDPSGVEATDLGLDPGAATVSRGGDADGTIDLAGVDEGQRPERSEGERASAAPARDVEATESDTDSSAAPRGRLVGRVTDGAGRPIAGADVEARISGELWMLGRRERDRPTAVTDALGAFTLDVQAGETLLAVGADGYAPYDHTAQVAADEDTDVGDLRLAAGVTLRGRVVDPSGAGVEGAELRRAPRATGSMTIVSFDGGETVTTTDSTGAFEIVRQGTGPYRFTVAHDDFPTAEFAGDAPTANGVVDGIVVSLRPGATLTGIVTGIPDDDREGLVVRATPSNDEFDSNLLVIGVSGRRSADVRDDGSFAIHGLEPGTFVRLELSKGDWRFNGTNRRSARERVRVGDSGVRLAYSRGSAVSFRVLDAAGEPVELDEVDIGTTYLSGRTPVAVDPSIGAYRLTDLWPSDDGEPMRFSLTVKGYRPYERDDLALQVGSEFELGTIVLQERPQLRVVVTSEATGEPVAGASVVAREYVEPQPGRRTVSWSARVEEEVEADDDTVRTFGDEDPRGTTDENGVCFLDATPGEPVRIEANHAEHARAVSAPVSLEEGESERSVALALPAGGAIDVLVVDTTGAPAPSYKVVVQDTEEDSPGPGEPLALTDETGRLTLRGVAAGPQNLRLGDRIQGSVLVMPRIRVAGFEDEQQYDWTSVEVIAGETVEVTLVAPARGHIEGELTELGVALAGATVEIRKPGGGSMLDRLMLGGGPPAATVDARGEFTIDDVEEGEHELVIEHPTRSMPTIWPVEVDPGKNRIEIDLTVTTIEGRVFGPDGEPLVGAVVEAERYQPPGRQRTAVARMVLTTDDGGGGMMMSIGDEGGEATRTDDDGRFVLRGVEADAPLVVVAKADGLDEKRSEPVTVAAGGSKDDVELRFSVTGAVRIEVENSQPGLIAILRKRGEFGGEPRIETLSGAATTVEGLAPGEWTCRIGSMQPGSNVSTDPDDVEFDVVGDETATVSFVVR